MPSVTRSKKAVQAAHREHAGACRALIGVRCSTDEQLDRYGPEVQKKACLALATREGLTVDPEADVVVIAQSVTKYVGANGAEALDGDFYGAIIERLKTGRYCAYLTYDMTRLTRSGVLHQLMLEQEVQRHVGRIHYANLAGVDTTTPEGETFKVIMAAVNRLRTVLDMARLTSAKRAQALAGLWVCETLPIGYALDVHHGLSPEAQRKRKRPAYRRVPYPRHAAVVEAMLRALVEHRGNPFRAATALKRAGVVVLPFDPDTAAVMAGRSALDRMGSRAEAGWHITPRMITAAARNRAYEGVLTWQGEEVGRDPRLAIVDPDLLAAARAALDGAARPRGRAAASDRAPLALTGLLYCAGSEADPHEAPVPAGAHPAHGNYRCTRHYRNGAAGGCLAIRARLIDDGIARFVFERLRAGGEADAVIAELEREEADRAAEERRREQDRKRLTREVATIEANLEMAFESELLTRDSLARREARLADKRAELLALTEDAPPVARRRLTAGEAGTVRAALENLDPARWSELDGWTQNDLLAFFLERVEVGHDGGRLTARVRWVGGREHVLVGERARYRGNEDGRWTDADDAALRTLYPRAPWAEVAAALPGRSRRAIGTQARRLGLSRSVRTPAAYDRQPPYGAAEDALIRRYAAGEIDLERVCAETGRSTFSVFVRTKRLGLRREGPRSKTEAVVFVDATPVESEHERTEDGPSSGPAVHALEAVLADPARLARLAALTGRAPARPGA